MGDARLRLRDLAWTVLTIVIGVLGMALVAKVIHLPAEGLPGKPVTVELRGVVQDDE